jgi:phage tail P2-like protein
MNKTIEIAPSSISGDPQVQAAAEAIDDELLAIYDCMSQVPGGILFWPFADVQDETMTDVLAFELHVDVWQGWDGDLSLEQKRDLINKSIDWHQHLGTKYAVEQMLRTVFRTGYVTEWYEYGGTPYHFRVTIAEPIVDQARLDRCIAGIMAVKNVRSWMEEIVTPSDTSSAFMYVAVIITQILENMSIPVSENPRPPVAMTSRKGGM